MTNGSVNNFHFKIWLPFFATLLLLIPVCIWLDFVFLAKISGITILVALLYALRQWFSVARQMNQRIERYMINANERFLIQSILPGFKSWSRADQNILYDQLGIFLTEVKFEGFSDKNYCLYIGMQVVLATWGSSYINKQDWKCTFIKDEESVVLEVKDQKLPLSIQANFAHSSTPEQAQSQASIQTLKEKLKNITD
ncbi:MAG: hypothetical protein RIR55_1401 [Bacteroidota bacterium]|jgi:hypothetical protein